MSTRAPTRHRQWSADVEVKARMMLLEGKTPGEVSRLTGIPRTTLYRWSRGK